ncbi:MAG: FAD-binding oxidoreductase [Sulfobacillus benefaciens]|uniref:FAD-binding oxidoreductase n=1 Tax=Sulfobacillus benefaciens TaxID=453960 RepID=A0A2T2XEF6_9FIRM|nr:MAG: FAD-binding oxidoreductase [Sulfobacillus benefaciens]
MVADSQSSYWTKTTDPFISTGSEGIPQRMDVIVVGGGLTGISAAYHLSRAGRQVMVLEAFDVGSGASGRNGGQALNGWPLDMRQIRERYGNDTAQVLWRFSEEALSRFVQIASDEEIVCDLQQVGHLDAAWTESDVLRLQEEQRVLAALGKQTEWWSKGEIWDRVGTSLYLGGIYDNACYQVNPLKFVQGLAKAAERQGAKIFCFAPVMAIDREPTGYRVRGQKFVSHAKEVILATNGYVPSFAHWVRSQLWSVASQVVVTDPQKGLLPEMMPTVSDSSQEYHYFRLVEHGRLLFGGRPPILPKIARMFPQMAQVPRAFEWEGRVAISWDGLPHFGRTPGGYWFAAGYTGHGVVLSTALGQLIAEAIAGKPVETSLTNVLGSTITRRPFSRRWRAR